MVAALNGNLPELEKTVPLIESRADHLLATIILNDIRAEYELTTLQESAQLAASLTLLTMNGRCLFTDD